MKFTNFEPISVNIDLEGIGKKIRIFREKRGLTQEQLANKISETCDARTISRYENGESEMRMGRYIELCVALEVTFNDLLPDNTLPAVANCSSSYVKYCRLNEIHKLAADHVINALYLEQNSSFKGI